MLLAVTAGSNLNERWLVPSGDVPLDQARLNRDTPLACALTFDDGPDSAGHTLEVLKILEQYGVVATFFLIGSNMEAWPDQVRAIRDAGHEIGSHSYNHPHMPDISCAAQERQLGRTSAIMAEFGLEPHWFRPPYGAYNTTTLSVVRDAGMSPINWSVDPRDWAQPGVNEIQRRVLNQTGPGSVILLHSTNEQTVAALPGIIKELQRKGYQFLTISQWSQLVSGDVELRELMRAPHELDPEWAEFIKPFISESAETVVMLPEDEREPVEPLRVFSNFGSFRNFRESKSHGWLNRFVELRFSGQVRRPSQFRQPPAALREYIRPVQHVTASGQNGSVLNTTIIPAQTVPIRMSPVAELPDAGFSLPALNVADLPASDEPVLPAEPQLLSRQPLNTQLFAGSESGGGNRLYLVLLRWATSRLAKSEQPVQLDVWDLPAGVNCDYYSNEQREVLILSQQQTTELDLPADSHGFLIVGINAEGQIVGTPLESGTLMIGPKPVILLRETATN